MIAVNGSVFVARAAHGGGARWRRVETSRCDVATVVTAVIISANYSDSVTRLAGT